MILVKTITRAEAHFRPYIVFETACVGLGMIFEMAPRCPTWAGAMKEIVGGLAGKPDRPRELDIGRSAETCNAMASSASPFV